MMILLDLWPKPPKNEEPKNEEQVVAARNLILASFL